MPTVPVGAQAHGATVLKQPKILCLRHAVAAEPKLVRQPVLPTVNLGATAIGVHALKEIATVMKPAKTVNAYLTVHRVTVNSVRYAVRKAIADIHPIPSCIVTTASAMNAKAKALPA